MLSIPRMARSVRPTRVVSAKAWAIRHYRRSMLRHPLLALSFVLFDPELDNYTYDLGNLDELGGFLARVLKLDRQRVDAYIREIEQDEAFRSDLNARLRLHPDRKPTALYGRRVGWYCMVRVTRPRLIIETGVHDGLGSSVLLQALHRNSMEGDAGRLYGIDINPKAGWLIPSQLRERFTLVTEDSATALPKIMRDQAVDLFIHDSDHRYAHEFKEFELVAGGLSAGGILLSDNSHSTSALKDFSEARSRTYAFWQEQPKGHFYPGGGIGMSLPHVGRLG